MNADLLYHNYCLSFEIGEFGPHRGAKGDLQGSSTLDAGKRQVEMQKRSAPHF